jgi:hypothetical protein
MTSSRGFAPRSITRMPTDKMGLLFLKDGKPGEYTAHAGQRRGHWPSSPEITAAMFERYKQRWNPGDSAP